MLKRLILSSVLLISYAGAILHSVVPHHHHHSQEEAKEHHHDDHHHHQANHSHDHDAPQHDNHHQADATYLFAHSANADVIMSHTSIDGAVKGKKTEVQTVFIEFPLLHQTEAEQVFHAPPNDRLTTSTASPFPALRAPPFSLC